jgi:hypothetical protein
MKILDKPINNRFSTLQRVARSLIILSGQTGRFFLARLRGEHFEAARADAAAPTGFPR